MKKYILLFSLLFMLITAKTQNDTIGEVVITNNNNNYFLLNGNDTVLMDTASIVIKFYSNIDEAGKELFTQEFNLLYVRETSGEWFHFRLPVTCNFISLCDSIYNDLRVNELCYNVMIELYGFEPDDPELNYQWYLDRIDAPEAWNITVGNENVVVAIIDEGLFLQHDDIGYGNDSFEGVFHNDGEDEWSTWYDPSTGNEIDDDDFDNDPTTFIDDWKGWDFGDFNPNLNPPGFEEDNNVIPEKDWGYHGTAISGIIAAKTNNNNDMAGIAGGNYADNIEGVKILPIKVSDYKWDYYYNKWVYWQSTEYISAAIDYAVEMNADIISLSIKIYDSPTVTGPIESAFQNAHNNNVFIVAAAGNEGYDYTITYPGKSDYTMAVGASDQNDEDCDFSNNGAELEIVAPGTDILSLDNDGTVYDLEGNSFSAPMVAATAALMRSIIPELPNTTIWDILINTAEEVGSHSYNNGWNKYMGYGRLNTYYAVCEVLKLLPPKTINFTDVWYGPVYTLHDIIIESGGTLVVYSTVALGNDARIIVKPGATLIVDGGTLTNYKFCGHEDNLWKGVEVWGNDEQSQYPCNGTQYQGKIVLQNGATIENAEIGVLLCARDGVNYNTDYSGGIIQISDDQNESTRSAYFINNKYSINFKEYSNYSLGPNCSNLAPADNLSFIKDCKFEINQDYLENSWHKACIYMSDVNGIKIAGCEFVNNYNELHGHGINAYNAGFKVYDLCNSQVLPCPEGEESECTFTNFGKGINLGNSNSTNTLSVENAVFTNNSNGITLSNVHNAAVLFSDFYIGENPDEEGECEGEGQAASGYGIDMTGCTGFAIEENNIYKYSGAPSGDYTGVRCKDSHTQYDLIYLNTFEGLSYGNFAEGMNRDIINDAHGLEFQCNTNTGNITDFQVTTYDPLVSPAMIRGYMGYTNISAGNTFSQQSGVDWHFLNLGTQQIDYWWYIGNSIEEPEHYCTPAPNPYPDPCYFTPYSITYENTCPSHYGGGGSGGNDERSIVLTPQQFQETEQQYLDALNDFNNMKALYDNLKDGGNTQSLESEVETAMPSDMWQLRTELLGVSPHVSKDVLMTTAEKTDVFPESVLFEILSANPDELKNGDMISFLENKEQPLPEYMIDMLKQIAGGVTYKTILKRQMADFHAKKSQAVHDIIISILADTVMDMQFYRAWLDNLGGIEADKQIIASYIQEGNFSSTQTLLDLIPSLYELTGDRLLQYNDYKSLTEFQIDIEQQNRSILELDNNEIDFLVNLAENSSGTAKVVARNILNFGYGYNYCHCLPTDSSTMKSSAIDFEKPENDNGLYINAEPNPADTWVAFNVKIPSYINEAVLKITDINGKRTKEFSIDSRQGQKLWDIRGIKSGIYLYTLEAGTIKKSGKLIIK